jgi:hypothetical protein
MEDRVTCDARMPAVTTGGPENQPGSGAVRTSTDQVTRLEGASGRLVRPRCYVHGAAQRVSRPLGHGRRGQSWLGHGGDGRWLDAG